MNRKALAAAGAAGVALSLLSSAEESDDDDENDESECPICGKSVDPRGLSGHLQFGHGVAGEDVSEVTSSGSPQDVEVTNESA